MQQKNHEEGKSLSSGTKPSRCAYSGGQTARYQQSKGILFVILSALIFGFTPILGTISYAHGSNPVTLSFFRGILALPLLLIWVGLSRQPLRLEKNQSFRILILSIFGSAATTLLLYSSYQYLSVGLATTLHFIYPLVVTIGEILFFGAPFRRFKGIALALAGGGILLLCDPGKVHVGGAALALLSGFTYGFYLLEMVRSGLQDLHPSVLTFYTCLINSCFIGLYGLFNQQLTIKLDGTGWLYTLIVSLLTSFGGVALLQLGVRLTGPSTASILSTFEPLFSVFLGVLLLNEPMNVIKFIGCCLIVGAVLVLTLVPVLRQRRNRLENQLR